MAVEFKLPDLGENVEEADVADVLVSAGDRIEKNQPVLEAETEKAVMEIPSTVSGTVQEVKIKKGDTIRVGQVILTVDEAEAKEGKAEKKEEKAAKKAADEQAERRAKEAEEAGREEGQRKEAASAEEAEAAEAERQEPAPAGRGRLDSAPDSPKTAAAETPRTAAAERAPVAAAPSVRQFAREIGIDIHEVPGSGPGGRISTDDVKAYARQQFGTAAGAPAAGREAGPSVVREAMTKVRKVTASHMAATWAAVPHVTLHDRADVTELEHFRQRYKKKAEAAGGRLTITAIFVKIVTGALRVFPKLNASIDTERQEIEYHNYCHIGVAVDTPRGLVVPVIRDADRKNIIQLAVELTEVSGRAREGKLRPEEMRGGTFTVTNLGSIGTGFFTPIVNLPEAAILGMGRAGREPVWTDGQFLPRLMAPLSLSFDHRLVDGAEGARALRWIVEAAQSPVLLAMEG